MNAIAARVIPSQDSLNSHEMLRQLFMALKADYVVMVHAFFDESGSHKGAPVTCVGGYLFETEQALRFDVEWRRALDDFGIKRFHMSECAHGVGEFKDIPKTDRIELESRLIGAIKRRARIGIVASVCEDDYRVASPSLVDQGWAYIACFVWCMAGVASWVSRSAVTGEISYFFEAGHRLQGIANRAMNDVSNSEVLRKGALYNSHTFIKKTNAHGIQAADLLVWLWHAEWRNRSSEPRRGRRADFNSLVKLPHITSHLTASHLAAIGALLGQDQQLPDHLRRFDFTA